MKTLKVGRYKGRPTKKRSTVKRLIQNSKLRQLEEEAKLKKWAKGVKLDYSQKDAVSLFESTSDEARMKLVNIAIKTMALSDSVVRANATFQNLGMDKISFNERVSPIHLGKLLDTKLFITFLESLNFDEESESSIRQLFIDNKFGNKVIPNDKNSSNRPIQRSLQKIIETEFENFKNQGRRNT